ncbi:AMP-binding protein [Microvirga sp. 17 mud 1-3]|uniref:AMP-binding protein n=1 Tax=Microvirga sp. 17 mud 1-3 TaxID=2082949 RepID=UPI000D6D2283|nr:AMP-binding protein [Microvirga sp. 17 mud 1-3]AWM86342.1 acyl-phosphate glycerol 3-phosphate acyltransferase [Microvirga sp. 17 mud 1-3]
MSKTTRAPPENILVSQTGDDTDAAFQKSEVAGRVIDIVSQLVSEVHSSFGSARAVALQSNLDRDLALDSLARTELLLRLNRAFKVRLPNKLLGEAETPADLVAAIIRAAPRSRAAPEPGGALAPPQPPVAEPAEASTLLEALAFHVRAHPERIHIYLRQEDGTEEPITYTQLDREARAVAAGLLARGLSPGDRVGIMLPTERSFFVTFFGILCAGGVPVPIYPPFRRAMLEDHLRRQAGILRNAEASILITNEEIHAAAGLLLGLVSSLNRVTTVQELRRAAPLPAPLPATADTTALIQYTSGSTGDPKGVVLSHTNLLANIRAIGDALGASSSDVVVSWLPLYHDMGLIGCWLGSLYYGALAVLMPPLSFLADPMVWLWTVHRHRATITAGPNFAFELCLKVAPDSALDNLDLRSLRAVMNGAEPVSPSTIRRFEEHFTPYGFRPDAMVPVYGLAESSVGLAFPPRGRAPIVDRVGRQTLTRNGVARPAAPEDATALEFVACGQPLPKHQIRIVDEDGRELPERHEGRLQFKGPSATAGYFRNPEKTQALFDGNWLESGDRAYIAGGDIYITGRIKDMIKRAGRNIYPQELEDRVGSLDGVRKGCVAVFASPDPRTGTERLVVMAETRLTDPSQLDTLRLAIIDASQSILDLPPDDIIFVPPHTVPKTSSGKIRRSAARALYETGGAGGGLHHPSLQVARLLVASALPRLHRARRALGSWAYAAWWWLLLGTVAFVLWPTVVLLPRRSWRWSALGTGARLFFRLSGIPLSIEAAAPLPSRAFVLIANHSSYLDGAVLSAAIPGGLTFVAKQELAEQILAGPFLRRLGTVFVRRTDPAGGVADTGHALEAVCAGGRLAWFPEGTFTRMPGLLAFHLGAFEIASQASAPIVPVVIRGTRSILRSDQWLPRRGAIAVYIGEPIDPAGQDFTAAIRLRDTARAQILARLGEPDLARERVDLRESIP